MLIVTHIMENVIISCNWVHINCPFGICVLNYASIIVISRFMGFQS